MNLVTTTFLQRFLPEEEADSTGNWARSLPTVQFKGHLANTATGARIDLRG